jgi:hypothetical protein
MLVSWGSCLNATMSRNGWGRSLITVGDSLVIGLLGIVLGSAVTIAGLVKGFVPAMGVVLIILGAALFTQLYSQPSRTRQAIRKSRFKPSPRS